MLDLSDSLTLHNTMTHGQTLNQVISNDQRQQSQHNQVLCSIIL